MKFLLFGRLCLQPMPATRWASSLKVASSAPHLTQHSKDEYSRTCTAPHRKSFHSTSPLALWLETPRCRWVNRCAVLLSAWGRGIYRRKKGWYIYARRYLVAGNTSCTAHNAHVNVDDICILHQQSVTTKLSFAVKQLGQTLTATRLRQLHHRRSQRTCQRT